MTPHTDNPWLGLNTYTESQKLYGRDTESIQVANIILNNPLTTIYGRSGIGKSSLLQAGVFPRMRYEDYKPIYIRLVHNSAESYEQQIKHIVLDNCLSDETISVQWKEDASSLKELLQGISLREKSTNFTKHLLLVFDQFEEIFTLPSHTQKTQVATFFSELADTLHDTSIIREGVRLVICLREDYLYYLEQHSSTIPELKRNRYRLQALSRAKGKEVIECPRPGLVSPEVSEAILQTIDSEQTDIIDPAILSLFLHELYTKGTGTITLELVHQYGDNIIANFYQEGMAVLSSKTIDFLEDRLVTSDGYRHTLSYNDAIAHGVTKEELSHLQNRRIITIEKGSKTQRIVELSHDVLCPIVCKNKNARKQQQEKEQLIAKAKKARRDFLFILTIAVLSVTLMVLFATQWIQLNKHQQTLLINQSRFVAKVSQEIEKKGDPIKALALAFSAFPKDLKHPERPYTHEAYDRLLQLRWKLAPFKNVLKGHTDHVSYARFKSAGTEIFTVSKDKDGIIWNAKTGAIINRFKDLFKYCDSFQFSPDGEKIFIQKSDNAVIVDANNGKVITQLANYDPDYFDISAHSVRFSPNGEQVLTISWRDESILWDVATGNMIRKFEKSLSNIVDAQFSPDGQKIAASSENHNATIWNTETGKVITILKGHTGRVNTVRFSSDGKKVVTASEDRTAIIWNAETGDLITRLAGHSNALHTALFRPDGNQVITASNDGTALLWNLKWKYIQGRLKGHKSTITSAQYSSDGTQVVTASDDGTAIVWDTETGKVIFKLQGHQQRINSAVYSSDNKHIVTASADHTAILWNVEIIGNSKSILYRNDINMRNTIFSPDSKKIITNLKDSIPQVWDIDVRKPILDLDKKIYQSNVNIFSPDGTKIVSECCDNTVTIWDAETGQQLSEIKIKEGISDFQISANNEKIVIVSTNNHVTIWDLETGRALTKLPIDNAYSVQISPDGKKLAILIGERNPKHGYIEKQRKISIWDTESGKMLLKNEEHKKDVKSMHFSPDGKQIVTASADEKTIIWDAQTGQTLIQLGESPSSIHEAQFSLDGQKIVTASHDSTAVIWNSQTGKMLTKLEGSTSTIICAQFSPDGTKVVTTSEDGTVIVWEVETGMPITKTTDNQGSLGGIIYAAFSPNGKMIITRSTYQYTSILNLYTPQELIDWAGTLLNGYELTAKDRKKYYLE